MLGCNSEEDLLTTESKGLKRQIRNFRSVRCHKQGQYRAQMGDTGGHTPSVGVWGDSLEHVTSELSPKVRDSQEGQSSEGTEAECVPAN